MANGSGQMLFRALAMCFLFQKWDHDLKVSVERAFELCVVRRTFSSDGSVVRVELHIAN